MRRTRTGTIVNRCPAATAVSATSSGTAPGGMLASMGSRISGNRVGERGADGVLGHVQPGGERQQREVTGAAAGECVPGQPGHQISGASRRLRRASPAPAERTADVRREQSPRPPAFQLARGDRGAVPGSVRDQLLVGLARR